MGGEQGRERGRLLLSYRNYASPPGSIPRISAMMKRSGGKCFLLSSRRGRVSGTELSREAGWGGEEGGGQGGGEQKVEGSCDGTFWERSPAQPISC